MDPSIFLHPPTFESSSAHTVATVASSSKGVNKPANESQCSVALCSTLQGYKKYDNSAKMGLQK